MGNKVYLFGGEDAARRPQGDLFVLDLADMEWQSPEVTGMLLFCMACRVPIRTHCDTAECIVMYIMSQVCEVGKAYSFGS